MPRFFNRKIEIRFDDDSLKQIDHIANALGLSRAEFVRLSVLTSADRYLSPGAITDPAKPPLTVQEYNRMVSKAHKATGGCISRIQAETCVAVVLQALFLPSTMV